MNKKRTRTNIRTESKLKENVNYFHWFSLAQILSHLDTFLFRNNQHHSDDNNEEDGLCMWLSLYFSWNFVYLCCHIIRFGDHLNPKEMALTHLSTSSSSSSSHLSSFVQHFLFSRKTWALAAAKKGLNYLIIQFNCFVRKSHTPNDRIVANMMCSIVKVLLLWLALIWPLSSVLSVVCAFFCETS